MTPLLFLPGMMCDARLFAPQIAALSAHRAVMACPAGAHDSMQALAAEVLAHAPPRFALAGLSMGGILAMEVLRQAPGRIAGLALMDTNPLAELDEVKARRAPQIAAVRQGGLADVMRGQMIPNYLHAPDPDGPIAGLCLDMALNLGPQVFVNQSVALRDRPDQTQVLRDYQGPTLILCGESDRLCPVARHRLMQDLMPQAALQVVPDAGHLPVLEQPEHVTALLRRWLEEI
ncbi:alpha/beta fold hydrolase [Paracoccus homiensis]|uniref:Pimeloyl-ACP methyl ester carboxylesterase n=1 Tax=Paracoccus homiensis TaxID=364199 RepID=A0A1I0JH07_9RHOB|nr:alpha/beta fold hydrolase [Paracoccus homiensis]SEU09354.1 Pimeloyl-ACP methyl ester carboxylesterase [Paracoccus homiensis]